jgi:DNA polymerase V
MMFQPYFKVKWILDKYQAEIFSSNYELYADMSNRMHAITGSFAVAQEVYSIDESFLDLTGLNTHYNLTEYGHQI